jgi:hypothetical protein
MMSDSAGPKSGHNSGPCRVSSRRDTWRSTIDGSSRRSPFSMEVRRARTSSVDSESSLTYERNMRRIRNNQCKGQLKRAVKVYYYFYLEKSVPRILHFLENSLIANVSLLEKVEERFQRLSGRQAFLGHFP